ncbi:hypothetical protein [Escherichia coli]|uniref:Uncharacterized protein n=1 Tax=Rhizobium phage RHEph21 TaxID=2836134 RepID=A0AAE8AVU7_9CAUD|nr:hypothetical protein [Escherichia coli]MBZ5882563.1 hypothetical protein [Escherichia coli]QXV74645.1 hypothetical protein [Rhizobium phage RHEph21]
MAAIFAAFFVVAVVLMKAEHAATERRLQRKVDEYKMYLDNTHASIRVHRDQLRRDYGILYDAPCDWYRKVTKGALDQ